jgi:hypothetical protein
MRKAGGTTRAARKLRPPARERRLVTKLRDQLDYCTGQTPHIMRWNPKSRGFIVGDVHAFQEQVMPRMGTSRNFLNFCRIARSWGFSRKRHVDGTIHFTHAVFCESGAALDDTIVNCRSRRTWSVALQKKTMVASLDKEVDLLRTCVARCSLTGDEAYNTTTALLMIKNSERPPPHAPVANRVRLAACC